MLIIANCGTSFCSIAEEVIVLMISRFAVRSFVCFPVHGLQRARRSPTPKAVFDESRCAQIHRLGGISIAPHGERSNGTEITGLEELEAAAAALPLQAG